MNKSPRSTKRSLASESSRKQPAKTKAQSAQQKASPGHSPTNTKARPSANSRNRRRRADPQTALPGGRVKLLSGGNPQIAKGDGPAPVQAYLSAIPDWRQEMACQVDRLIGDLVPDVQRAVRWNSPFYGREGQGWIIAMHVFAKFVKVTFFNGQALRPLPPGGTERSGNARWFDLREGASVADSQLSRWIHQAASLPGWRP